MPIKKKSKHEEDRSTRTKSDENEEEKESGAGWRLHGAGRPTKIDEGLPKGLRSNRLSADNEQRRRIRWTSDATSLSILLPSTIEEEDEEDDEEEEPDADAAAR